MKRELKGVDWLISDALYEIARPIPMKRELKGKAVCPLG